LTEPQNDTLWLFLETLGRRKRFVFSFIIVSTLLATGVSLLLKEEYDASALLLPPKEERMPVVNLADSRGGLSGIDLSSMSSSADVLVKILASRTIAYRIIDRFGLIQRYGKDNYIDAHRALLNQSKIVTTSEGLIFIGVTDYDAQMAADITNAYVEELYLISEDIVSSGARGKMDFFSERLKKVNEDLAEARKKLETFQSQNRAVDLEEQSKMVMEQAIELRVALSKVEIDLRVKELSNDDSSPELIKLRNRRTIVKEELNKLEYGSSDSSYFAIPISTISTLKSQYEVFYSRVRVAEALSKLLLQQLEQARIQESGSFPEFSVIQNAMKPERSFRPNRPLIVLVTFLLSIIAALFLAVLKDYLEKMETASPENYARVVFFVKSYLGWMPGIKNKP